MCSFAGRGGRPCSSVLIRGPVYYIKTRQQTTTSRVSTARPVRRGTILPWTFDSAPSASTLLFLPRHHGGQERVRIIIVVFVIVLLVCNRHRTRRRRHHVGGFRIGLYMCSYYRKLSCHPVKMAMDCHSSIIFYSFACCEALSLK